MLRFKDKVSDENTSLCLKVIRYLFLWNVKSYDNKSYNILREEVYEEKFCYSLRCFKLRQRYQLSELNKNDYFVVRIYIYIYIYMRFYIINIIIGDFVRNERN